MSTKEEPPVGIGVGELLLIEASVLKALCMTVNTSGSEVKAKILETVAEDDFYFPVNKEIFIALKDMMRKNVHVVYTNLEEVLHKRSVHVPEDFFIQDLFKGDLPRMSDLSQWIARMRGHGNDHPVGECYGTDEQNQHQTQPEYFSHDLLLSNKNVQSSRVQRFNVKFILQISKLNVQLYF